MAESTPRGDGIRPALAFRVGVSGARAIEPDQVAPARARTLAVLRTIATEIERLASDPSTVEVYDPASDRPRLRVLSPLAVGADRLVAEAALEAGYALDAALPFEASEYARDFPESVGEFESLLGKARTVVELDGGRGADENASYEAVGRYVVRNCDLLLALWDGEPARGKGGTAEIVRFAALTGMPIWWIDIKSGGEPRLISSAADWSQLASAPTGDLARANLVDYLEQTILPPLAPAPERPGMIGGATHFWSVARRAERSPLNTFLNEEPDAAPGANWPWGAFSVFLNWLAPRPPSNEPASSEPGPLAHPDWEARYQRADSLSIAYGMRYRSSYLLVIALAFLGLLLSAIDGPLPDVAGLPIAVAEFFALIGIAILVAYNHLNLSHERWISYRLLAELCRKQDMLAAIGRSLPRSEIQRLPADADQPVSEDEDEEIASREAWIAWYFEACARSAGAPERDSGAAKQHTMALARELIDRQTEYHRSRRLQCQTADRRLGKAGEIFFFLTLAAVLGRAALLVAGSHHEGAMRIGHEATTWIETNGAEWIGALAVIWSAASAALVGIRFYSEFALLARQSLRMEKLLAEARGDLAALDLSRPLASRTLGGRLHTLAIAMMHDVQGWADLFGIKTIETG